MVAAKIRTMEGTAETPFNKQRSDTRQFRDSGNESRARRNRLRVRCDDNGPHRHQGRWIESGRDSRGPWPTPPRRPEKPWDRTVVSRSRVDLRVPRPLLSARMLSRAIFLLILLGLTPAGPEFVEWIRHFAAEGDFADRADVKHRRLPAEQQEHGCAVLCHGCNCHGPSGTSRELPTVQDDQPPHRANTIAANFAFVPQDRPAPPNPPPIA